MWPNAFDADASKYYFYSHIPCGMWLLRWELRSSRRRFLLTHPVWDVTNSWYCQIQKRNISTHTSRVGCDWYPLYLFLHLPNFYSHIPCGMWQIWLADCYWLWYFYSHIPCGMWQSWTKNHIAATQFLLTHPVWDVTAIYSIFQSHYSHILQDGPIIHLELY